MPWSKVYTPMNSRRLWVIPVILFFLAGAAGSYFFMRSFVRQEKQPPSANGQTPLVESIDFSVLRIYQPRNNGLEMTERKIPKRISNTSLAEAVIEEFFKQTFA